MVSKFEPCRTPFFAGEPSRQTLHIAARVHCSAHGRFVITFDDRTGDPVEVRACGTHRRAFLRRLGVRGRTMLSARTRLASIEDDNFEITIALVD